MIEIVIPESIKVGCYEYTIDTSGVLNSQLEADHKRAWCVFVDHTIHISSKLDQQDIMNCFCHEVVHCIDAAYLNQELPENQVAIIGNALHQVLNDMGIRFVLKK